MTPPLKRPSITDLIVDHLLKRIREKELRPGDRLPSEQELARSLGVSRNSLREAFKRLASLGLLEIRQGEGTFLKTPSVSSTIETLSPFLQVDGPQLQELFEARLYLEKGTARLAALRMDPAQLAQVDALIEEMERASLADPDAYAENDFRFHFLIAEAAGNSVLKRMLETVSQLIRDQQGLISQAHFSRRLTLKDHREIARALHAHDPLAAETAMEKHLREAEKVLRAQLAETGSSGGRQEAWPPLDRVPS